MSFSGAANGCIAATAWRPERRYSADNPCIQEPRMKELVVIALLVRAASADADAELRAIEESRGAAIQGATAAVKR